MSALFLICLMYGCLVYQNTSDWKGIGQKHLYSFYEINAILHNPERTIPILPFFLVVTDKNNKGYNLEVGLTYTGNDSVIEVTNLAYSIYNFSNELLISDKQINPVIYSFYKSEYIANTQGSYHVITLNKGYPISILEEKEVGDSIFINFSMLILLDNKQIDTVKFERLTLKKSRFKDFSSFI